MNQFFFTLKPSKIQVTWDGSDFRWTATMLIQDVVGFNKDDDFGYHVDIFGFFPERRITRARWTISGKGSLLVPKKGKSSGALPCAFQSTNAEQHGTGPEQTSAHQTRRE